MSGMIIYQSKYGSTKQYAEWIAEETGFDIYTSTHCPDDLQRYDTFVVGCSVVAGSLSLAKWVCKHWATLQRKKVIFFYTNVSADPNELAKILPRNFPDDMLHKIHAFPLRGRYIFSELTFLDRTLIRAFSTLVKNPEVKRQLLTDYDGVRKENLQALLTLIKLGEDPAVKDSI